MPFDNIQPANPDPKIENDPMLIALKRVHELLAKGYMKYRMRDGRGNFCAVGAVQEAAIQSGRYFSYDRQPTSSAILQRLGAHAVRPTNFVLDPGSPYPHSPEQLEAMIKRFWEDRNCFTARVIWCNNQTDKETTLKMVSDAIATRRNELMGLAPV